MVSRLQWYRRPLTTVYSDRDLTNYLKDHFTKSSQSAKSRTLGQGILASAMDPDKLVLFGRCFMSDTVYMSLIPHDAFFYYVATIHT